MCAIIYWTDQHDRRRQTEARTTVTRVYAGAPGYIMTDDAEKRPVGRPRNEYTDEQVRAVTALAQIMCPLREIESITGIDKSSLSRHFETIIKKGEDTGRMSLRRRQWKQADEGSVPMQIWLGKQWLDQVDKSHTENKNEFSTTGSLDTLLSRLNPTAASGDTDGSDG